MKRPLFYALVVTVAVALAYPYQGIWAPAQIRRASVDGQIVPRERIPELYWDLQASRLSDPPSKCLGWVELELKNGAQKHGRLSSSIALRRWSPDCP